MTLTVPEACIHASEALWGLRTQRVHTTNGALRRREGLMFLPKQTPPNWALEGDTSAVEADV